MADKHPPLRPFQNESDVASIGDLTVENRVDRIEIHGSVTLSKDKKGYLAALALKQILDATVEALKSERLPDEIADVPTKSVPNPFAK